MLYIYNIKTRLYTMSEKPPPVIGIEKWLGTAKPEGRGARWHRVTFTLDFRFLGTGLMRLKANLLQKIHNCNEVQITFKQSCRFPPTAYLRDW